MTSNSATAVAKREIAFGDGRLPSRFWGKVHPATNGCWLWTASKTDGYGYFGVGSKMDGTRRMAYAHRWAYEHLVGIIPTGLILDHLCRNRACINPFHLEIVTNKDNILRGNGISAKEAQKRNCIRGHPFDFFNTYKDPRGKRYCRACKIMRRQRAIAYENLQRAADREGERCQ